MYPADEEVSGMLVKPYAVTSKAVKSKDFPTGPSGVLNVIKTRACGFKFYCEQMTTCFIFLIVEGGVINNSTYLRIVRIE